MGTVFRTVHVSGGPQADSRGAFRMWIRYKLAQPMPEPYAQQFIALSGPKFNPARTEIRAHMNCAWLVQRGLESMGMRFTASGPLQVPPPLDADQALAPTELRDLARDFIQRVPYQLRGLCKVSPFRGASLWWPTGAGKTLPSLIFGLQRPMPIVLITRGGAKRQMVDEIWRFTTVRAALLEGKKAADLDPLHPARIYVTGWEVLGDQLPAIAKLGIFTVIADEAHRAKGGNRWKGAIRAEPTETGRMTDWTVKDNLAGDVYKLAQIASAWINTTASSVANGTIDIWAQLDHQDPGAWGSRRQFAFRYAGAEKAEYGGPLAWKPGKDTNIEELQARLYQWSGISRVDDAEVARDLPPMRRQVVYVTQEEQLKSVTGFAQDMKAAVKLGDKDTEHELQLQIAAVKKKPRVVRDVVQFLDEGKKLLLFLERVETAKMLFDAIKSKRPDVKGWLVAGHDYDDARQTQLEYMGDPEKSTKPWPGPCFIIGTGAQLGESLNLQDTDVIGHVQLPWRPVDIAQREGRGRRHGMSRPLLSMYWVAEGTRDEHVVESVLKKLPSVENVQGQTQLDGLIEALEGDEGDTLTQSLVGKILNAPWDEDLEAT